VPLVGRFASATASQKAQSSGRPCGVASAIEPPGREAFKTMFLKQANLKVGLEVFDDI